MHRFFASFVIVILLAVTAAGAASPAQPPTAQELFDRCGPACDLTATAHSKGEVVFAAVAEPRGPFAILRTPGSIVTGTSGSLSLDIVRDFDGPVWIAGRVFQIADGRPQPERPFYAARNLQLTRFGAGYFPRLDAGGVIPLADIPVGNAGEQTVVQVVLFDSANGGRPMQNLRTAMWSRVRSASQSGRVDVTVAEILSSDGETLHLTGRFPIGERLLVEVGDPEWDAGFQEVLVRQDQATNLFVRIPPGKTGNRLYPGLWQAESVWGFTILTQDGENFSFPGLLRVVGLPDGRVANAK